MPKRPHSHSSAGQRDSPPRWFFSIQARIFLAMAGLAALLLIFLSLLIEGQARREMEQEMTKKLQAVGGAAVSLIGPSLVPALTSLSTAQSGFTIYQDRLNVLTQLRDRTGVRRIFLADTTGRSFLDTDSRIGIGTPLTQLRSDRLEILAVRQGRPAAAALFTDDEGRLRKTGYVPVLQRETVIGLVGVEGDATFLSAVRKLRGRILTVGAAGIVLAFLIAAPLSRGLTRPLYRLVAWARRFGAGNLTEPVPAQGRDEISFLGRTLEQMRGRLEERDREQRAMVAGVAHEIRNPLSGIRLYAELLGEEPGLKGAAEDRLQKILRELEHLSSIVEEFLLYARPEAANPTSVAVGETLWELVEWIRPQATQLGVSVPDPRGASIAGGHGVALAGARGGTTASPRAATTPGSRGGRGEEGLTVLCDPTHLRQILRNLVLNAVDATGEGKVVEVGCRRADGLVRILVEDRGPGIPEEHRERIFEPFYTTKANGAGLGLPIVRRLALLNEGRIEVETGEYGGARFVLTLPEAS